MVQLRGSMADRRPRHAPLPLRPLQQSPGSPAGLRRSRTVPVRVLVPNLITLLAQRRLDCDPLRGRGQARMVAGADRLRGGARRDRRPGGAAPQGHLALRRRARQPRRLRQFRRRPGADPRFLDPARVSNSAGWIAALVFAIAVGRARALQRDDRRPQPPGLGGENSSSACGAGGAIAVLLPVYMHFLDVPHVVIIPQVTFVYTLAIGFLWCRGCRCLREAAGGRGCHPTSWSSSSSGSCCSSGWWIRHPGEVLTIGTIIYLGSLPFGVLSYREHARRDTRRPPRRNPATLRCRSTPPTAVPFAAKPAEKPRRRAPDERH